MSLYVRNYNLIYVKISFKEEEKEKENEFSHTAI